MPRPPGFEPHEVHERRACGGACEVSFRAAKPFQIFLRQIDSSHREIFRNVPQNIRQLKSNSELWRQFQGGGIAKSKHVHTAESYGAGYAIAIPLEKLEAGIAVDGQIHLCAGDRIV